MSVRSWLNRKLAVPVPVEPVQSVPYVNKRPFPPVAEDDTCRVVQIGRYANANVSKELFEKYRESGTYDGKACVIYVPFDVLGERFARSVANTCYMIAPIEVPDVIFVMGKSRIEQCVDAVEHGMVLLHDFSGSMIIEQQHDAVIGHREITTRGGYCLTGQEDDHPWSYFGEINATNAEKIALSEWTRLMQRMKQMMTDGYVMMDDAGLYTFPKAMDLLTFGMCQIDFPVDTSDGLVNVAYEVTTPFDDLFRFDVYCEIKKKAEEVEDILDIWERYLYDNAITMALRRPSPDYRGQIEHIDKMIGVKSAIKAYYEGVPKDYLLCSA